MRASAHIDVTRCLFNSNKKRNMLYGLVQMVKGCGKSRPHLPWNSGEGTGDTVKVSKFRNMLEQVSSNTEEQPLLCHNMHMATLSCTQRSNGFLFSGSEKILIYERNIYVEVGQDVVI